MPLTSVHEVQRFPFHTMRGLKAGRSVAYCLTRFSPASPAWVIGAMLGLLTLNNADHDKGSVELYVAITYNQARASKSRWWAQYKKDFLFYSQRDIYSAPTSPHDLTQYIWLPTDCYFPVSQAKPISILGGAASSLDWDTVYDIFGCIYYIGVQNVK